MHIPDQLELLGLEGTKRVAMAAGATLAEKSRIARRLETTHEMLATLPTADDLAFLHSGLAQTCLPHSRPADDKALWCRQSGRFSLIVQPGVIDDGRVVRHVGVPYGSRARLILLHLQSEGLKSRTVSLGPTLSAFLRSLGLPVSGHPSGSIVAIREQCEQDHAFDGAESTEFDVLPHFRFPPAVEGAGSGSGKSCGAVAVLVGFMVSRIAAVFSRPVRLER